MGEPVKKESHMRSYRWSIFKPGAGWLRVRNPTKWGSFCDAIVMSERSAEALRRDVGGEIVQVEVIAPERHTSDR